MKSVRAFWRLCAATWMVLATQADAQTFDLRLGNRVLGWVTYTKAASPNVHTLSSNLNNTPWRVFDGTFEATQTKKRSADGRSFIQFQTKGVSPKSSRVVTMLFRNGRPFEQVANPPFRTKKGARLSEIPSGTGDLLDAFSLVTSAQTCPKAFQMYDGLRWVRVSPNGQAQRDGILLCKMVYRVLKGPGHLPPIRFRTIDVALAYHQFNGKAALVRIDLTVGVLKASLARQ